MRPQPTNFKKILRAAIVHVAAIILSLPAWVFGIDSLFGFNWIDVDFLPLVAIGSACCICNSFAIILFTRPRDNSSLTGLAIVFSIFAAVPIVGLMAVYGILLLFYMIWKGLVFLTDIPDFASDRTFALAACIAGMVLGFILSSMGAWLKRSPRRLFKILRAFSLIAGCVLFTLPLLCWAWAALDEDGNFRMSLTLAGVALAIGGSSPILAKYFIKWTIGEQEQ